jgi:hypothetical protein
VKRCGILVVFVSLCASAQLASAAPIQAYGGWLDGTLRVFDFVETTPGSIEMVVRREYVLGVDFFPGVPLSFTQSGTDYVGCAGSFTTCVEQVMPWTTAFTPGGRVFPPPGTFGDPASQTPLTDGCPSLQNQGTLFSGNPVLMVARGNCTFTQKWQTAQFGGWGGSLVVDGPDDTLAGVGLIPTADEPTLIPLFRITAATAADIRRGAAFVTVPRVEMRVSWTQTPPQPVPEPSSLTLCAIGTMLIAVRRRRRVRAQVRTSRDSEMKPRH